MTNGKWQNQSRRFTLINADAAFFFDLCLSAFVSGDDVVLASAFFT
jgi:hypothetical protein